MFFFVRESPVDIDGANFAEIFAPTLSRGHQGCHLARLDPRTG